jgi:hypothetical protein
MRIEGFGSVAAVRDAQASREARVSFMVLFLGAGLDAV